MGKIYILIGKSASGKDTIYTKLLEDKRLDLKPYVGYTTRPKREGEEDGVEYHFTSEEDLKNFEEEGKLIEKRVYHTVYGDWYYYTVDSDEVDLENTNYLYIGTLESFQGIRDHYGADKVIPIYIEVEDGERLIRSIRRDQQQEVPGYEESCRRFLADAKDFSEEKIVSAGIGRRFDNEDTERCLDEIYKEVFGVRRS